jgi:8-oxo-dGTP pyrophosphatase MutT (NUDIX family)
MIEAAIVTAIRTRLTSALAPPDEPLRPLRVDGYAVGWVNGLRAARLAAFDYVFRADDDTISFVPSLSDAQARTEALDRVTRTLAAEGALTSWRDERYAVAPDVGAAPWFVLERAAARYFGVRTFAAHVNGLVGEAGDVSMWFARRSATKATDPGMLDNLVGGGIAAGQTIAETVIKESWEEAGLLAALAGSARRTGTVEIRRVRPDGLQRETIFIHDLKVPREFVPAGQDGEVVEHRLVGLDAAARLIANGSGPDVVTIDASLVVLDCLMRHRAIFNRSPDTAALVSLLHPSPSSFA